MRSAAHVRGHPIHPALIPFPFAFLYGAFFFDLAGWLTIHPSWWTTGGYLGLLGIVAALIAAVPGFIDYFKTVPPKSSGKRRATQHMILNLSAVLLFAAAWAFRGQPHIGPGAISLTLECLAIALLTVGGWLGGVLVSRNQISVDHRYVRAGRAGRFEFAVRPARYVLRFALTSLGTRCDRFYGWDTNPARSMGGV